MTSEVVGNTIFEKKKGKLSSEKITLPNFSRDIEHDKGQRTAYKGPKGLFTIIVQVISFFLMDLRDR